MYFLEALQVHAPMGVCCIVFDIDGMSFELFMRGEGGGLNRDGI